MPQRRDTAFENSRPPGVATFNGYDCIDDCSGHEAGYKWTEDRDINVPGDCGGNSQSFIEGCQTYAEEHERPAAESDTDNE